MSLISQFLTPEKSCPDLFAQILKLGPVLENAAQKYIDSCAKVVKLSREIQAINEYPKGPAYTLHGGFSEIKQKLLKSKISNLKLAKKERLESDFKTMILQECLEQITNAYSTLGCDPHKLQFVLGALEAIQNTLDSPVEFLCAVEESISHLNRTEDFEIKGITIRPHFI